MRYGLVACGSNSSGRIVGLNDLVGPFQPCDSMILYFVFQITLKKKKQALKFKSNTLNVFFNQLPYIRHTNRKNSKVSFHPRKFSEINSLALTELHNLTAVLNEILLLVSPVELHVPCAVLLKA